MAARKKAERLWNEFSKDILKSWECTVPIGY
jgi:hypothetical protein